VRRSASSGASGSPPDREAGGSRESRSDDGDKNRRGADGGEAPPRGRPRCVGGEDLRSHRQPEWMLDDAKEDRRLFFLQVKAPVFLLLTHATFGKTKLYGDLVRAFASTDIDISEAAPWARPSTGRRLRPAAARAAEERRSRRPASGEAIAAIRMSLIGIRSCRCKAGFGRREVELIREKGPAYL